MVKLDCFATPTKNSCKGMKYLSRRSVNGLLGSSDGVHGGHQTLNDLEVVVDNLCKGSEAVGGA